MENFYNGGSRKRERELFPFQTNSSVYTSAEVDSAREFRKRPSLSKEL